MASLGTDHRFRYVVLTWDGYDGWTVDEETDDHTAAVASVRLHHDTGTVARLVDTNEEV